MTATAKPQPPGATAPAGKPSTDAKATAEPKAKKANVDRKDESQEARFKRIAAPRIEKALAALRRLETVGRSPAYQFSTEQANRVMVYLDEAVEKVRAAFVARVNRKPETRIEL